MKIIDLLNKIANGEEVPKKIKYRGHIYQYQYKDTKETNIINYYHSEETHHHLMSTMQIKLENLVIAREKLEAVGLLKTYLKKDAVNNYVYVLYSPMSAADFLNHPILNVVLYSLFLFILYNFPSCKVPFPMIYYSQKG